ncbi:MAG: formate dehydrogenase subunit delta [Rhodanobacteraceae bacterium]|nr:formate dehydrogenase subunit delta [Rhodanobacteraceae bacterium]
MSPEKLQRMANDIARNLAALGDDAPAAIAEHLRQFWTPRMREELRALVEAGGEGLEPLVVEAAAGLRRAT